MNWPPCAVIDMDRVERNIARIQKACDDAGIANRPHIKTHKNPTIAKMQIASGAKGITCQNSARPRSWPMPASTTS